MNLSGIKGLASMAVIVLLVSGCSTPAPESKPEYDQLEVILWEACIYDYIQDLTYYQREKAQQAIRAEEFCLPLLPTRRD